VNPGASVAFSVPVPGRGSGTLIALDITQATEAQTLRAVAKLTLAAAAGESGTCVIHGAILLPTAR
jgi:hypothetical protein